VVGISAGRGFVSAMTLGFSESDSLGNSLLISTSLSFIVPASSSLSRRPGVISMIKKIMRLR
jgi:hypothetical protein